MISFHNTCARYGFALGQERVFASALGQTSPRSGAPVVASITQSVIGLIAQMRTSMNPETPETSLTLLPIA
jgi:amino acid transporter